MKSKWLCIAILLLLTSTMVRAAENKTIKFLCTWEDAAPLTITVNPNTMKASRDDGGKTYTIAKITEMGVWLIVDDPNNLFSLAMQMIQRGKASTPYKKLDAGKPYSAGSWIDVGSTLMGEGSVDSISGGKCWEQCPECKK